MRRLVVCTIALGILFAGCTSAGTSVGTPSASSAPIDSSVASVPPLPSLASPSPTVAATASPSVEPSTMPKALAESTLLAGIRKDAKVACSRQASPLPQAAIAGIECHPRSDLLTGVGFYLFGSQSDLLSTYLALLDAHGVAPRSGDCFGTKVGEDASQPGDGTDGFIAAREGCYVASGKASDLSTLPGQPVGDGGYTFGGPFVLVVINGATSNIGKLHDWAWLGNEAAPGAPTVWESKG